MLLFTVAIYGRNRVTRPQQHLPHGNDEFARPEVGEQQVQRRVAHVVRVGEVLHRDRTSSRINGSRGYLDVFFT